MFTILSSWKSLAAASALIASAAEASFVPFDVPVQEGEGFQLQCAVAGSVCDVKGVFDSSSKFGGGGGETGDCGLGRCQWISTGRQSYIYFIGPCKTPNTCWVYCDDDPAAMNNCTCTLGESDSNNNFVTNGTSCSVSPTVPPEDRSYYRFYDDGSDQAKIDCPSNATGAHCMLYGKMQSGGSGNFEEVATTEDPPTETRRVIGNTGANWNSNDCPDCVMGCNPLCTCQYYNVTDGANGGLDWIPTGDCEMVDMPAPMPTMTPSSAPVTVPPSAAPTPPTGWKAVALLAFSTILTMLGGVPLA